MVETVAENSVDGVIAPLFFLFIGGVPLMVAYKAVNTLDSMVGYRTENIVLSAVFRREWTILPISFQRV